MVAKQNAIKNAHKSKVVKRAVSPVSKKLNGGVRYKFDRPPVDERKIYPRERLVKAVEAVTGVPDSVFMSAKGGRTHGVVVPRHLVSWTLMMHTSMSMEQIGFFTNRKDHSSVVNSFNVVYENPEIFGPMKKLVYKELGEEV
jgi:hypothetical protein